jgi:hypothetical protein
MFKKGVFFVLFISLCFLACGQQGQNPNDPNDFEIIEENGTIIITKYKGTLKDVVIPKKINNLPVVSIGNNAFASL